MTRLTPGAAVSASTVVVTAMLGRAIGGECVDAGGNGGKGDRGQAVRLAKADGAAIARRQRLIFARVAAVPDRTDGMNHVPRR